MEAPDKDSSGSDDEEKQIEKIFKNFLFIGVDYGGLVEASDKESNGSDDEEKQIEKYKKLLQDIDKKDVKKKKKDVQMEITWEPGTAIR